MADTRHRVLVVDDDALILLLSCGILEDAGFEPLEASNVSQALEVLEVHAPAVELLFTDVEMPGGRTGFDLAREVAGRWPHIEIVIASGRVRPEAGDMPDKATFLGKPFSAEIIRDHLRKTLPEDKRPASLDAL